VWHRHQIFGNFGFDGRLLSAPYFHRCAARILFQNHSSPRFSGTIVKEEKSCHWSASDEVLLAAMAKEHLPFHFRVKSFVRKILNSKPPEPGGGSWWKFRATGNSYLDATTGDT
jgi:hypothetical protein